jgi:hypothetical protein
MDKGCKTENCNGKETIDFTIAWETNCVIYQAFARPILAPIILKRKYVYVPNL